MIPSALPIRSPVIGIVEDDAAVLNSLTFLLEAEGYVVLAFDHPDQAMESPDLVAADCLVIDYTLPGEDGASLLAQLRSRGVECPAILMASNPSRHCQRAAAQAGVPLVEKPLIGDVLQSRIRSALSQA